MLNCVIPFALYQQDLLSLVDRNATETEHCKNCLSLSFINAISLYRPLFIASTSLKYRDKIGVFLIQLIASCSFLFICQGNCYLLSFSSQVFLKWQYKQDLNQCNGNLRQAFSCNFSGQYMALAGWYALDYLKLLGLDRL